MSKKKTESVGDSLAGLAKIVKKLEEDRDKLAAENSALKTQNIEYETELERLRQEKAELTEKYERAEFNLQIFSIASETLRDHEHDKLMYAFLLGITNGKGLGYNQAKLWTYDSATNHLELQMAIGAETPEQFKTAGLVGIEEVVAKVKGFTAEKKEKEKIDLDADEDMRKAVLEEQTTQYLPQRNSIEAEHALVPLKIGPDIVGIIEVNNRHTPKSIRDNIDALKEYARFIAASLCIEGYEKRIRETTNLAALGQALTKVAHEIRNPLVTMGGFVGSVRKAIAEYFDNIADYLTDSYQTMDRLIDETENPQPDHPLIQYQVEILKRFEENRATKEDILRKLDISAKENLHLEAILNDCLDFAGNGKLNYSQFSIQELLESITEGPDKDRIKIQYSRPQVEIKADPIKVGHILSNLVRNGLEAMGKEGNIDITMDTAYRLTNSLYSRYADAIDNPISAQGRFIDETTLQTLRHQPGFTDYQDQIEAYMVIQVKDDGPGIPPERINEIFLPFVTYKQEGTGLGLAVVTANVQAHNGTVSVKSKVGEGTEFTVMLPYIPKLN